jgi:uncharacterized membrane-anchored protein
MERSGETMNPKWVFGLFLILAVIQVAMPLGQIWKYEDVLATGRLYKFRTAPVDPYDAFRGKYVALNYAGTEAMLHEGDHFDRGDPAYVSLRQDENGFAQFVELCAKPPASGDYLRVEYQYIQANKAHFRLLFDRYFMEETKAPQADLAYRRYGNRPGQAKDSAYVLAHVKGGRGVIEDLYIEDQPVREFLKTMPKQ